MAAKSKIVVEVDSGKFDELYRAFNRYKEALEQTPDAWRATELATSAVREGFEQAAVDIAEMASNMANVLDNSRKLDRVSEGTSRHWKDMARNTANVAGNIAKATASLLKWAGITSVIGALTGGGALFGMDRLAESVATGRTQSMGLGTSYGGLSAFRIQFGRLGNPEGILGRVSNALTSPEGRSIFQQMGMNQGELNGDTADVATRAILHMKDILDTIPKGQLATGMQAHRLDQLIDMSTARVLQGMSRKEVAGLVGGMPGLRKQLDLSPAQQLSWQTFLTKMDRASKIISSKFIDSLSSLTGPLGNLATSFSKLLAVLMKDGGPLQLFINKMAEGLESLVKYFRPENKSSVEQTIKEWEGRLAEVGHALLGLGTAVVKIGNFFGWLLGVPPAAAATGPAGEGSGGVGSAGRADSAGRGFRGSTGAAGATGSGGGASPSAHGVNEKWGGVSSGEGNLTKLIEAESRRAGIDPRIMEGIRAGESGHGSRYDVKDDALESSWGPFQLNRRRGLGVEFEKDTGLDLRDPSTIAAQARWVAQYIAKGRSLRPWAGYHGPRDADPRWGDSGYRPTKEAAAPPSVDPFAFAKHTLAGRKVKVTVNNSSGANPTMLMNAAAAH